MIHTARNIENQSEIREQIYAAVAKRCNNFQTNTKKMINSILGRHTDAVILNNIATSSDIITDATEIKEEVSRHFSNWTKFNPTDQTQWPEWEQYYKPLDSIDREWYQSLSHTITE